MTFNNSHTTCQKLHLDRKSTRLKYKNVLGFHTTILKATINGIKTSFGRTPYSWCAPFHDRYNWVWTGLLCSSWKTYHTNHTHTHT